MSHSPRYATLSPNTFLNGIVADPVPHRQRGWIEDEYFDQPGASINVNAPTLTMTVRNARTELEAGANVPKAGRAAGSQRGTFGVYAPSTLTAVMQIFGIEIPQSPIFAPQNLPWLLDGQGVTGSRSALAETDQRAWEQRTVTIMSEGVGLLKERSLAEKLYGTDLAGTSAAFTYSALSADATHNPDALTIDDPKFPVIDFLARAVETLDLALGSGGQRRYTIQVGRKTARKLAGNLQLLGIQLKTDDTGTAMVNGQIRLKAEALKARMEEQDGIRKFLVGGAVFSQTLMSAGAASHQWFWPDGISIVAVGDADADVSAMNPSQVSVTNTGLIRFVRSRGRAKIWLPEDEIQMQGFAEAELVHKAVSSSAGLSWGNS